MSLYQVGACGADDIYANPEELSRPKRYIGPPVLTMSKSANDTGDRVRVGIKLVKYLRKKGLSYYQCNQVFKILQADPELVKRVYDVLKIRSGRGAKK